MIEIPTHHAGETEVDYLRRKEEAFGLWQADALEHIRALEAENELLRQDKLRRVVALNATRNILNAVSDMILKENFDMPIDTFARDYAPFRNVMAHHGMALNVKKKQRKS